MTTMPPSKTPQRSRIVLVGRATMLCNVDDGLGEESEALVVRAANLFDAIGEISTAPVREPIGLLVLAPEALNEMSDRTLDTIRRIEPAVRIVLVQDEPAEARPVNPVAFDARLNAPVTSSQLIQLLNGAATSSVAQSPAKLSEPSPSERPTDTAELHENITNSTKSQAAEPLGDIDLVDALHSRSEGIQELAVQLIRQQTGWDDLQLREQQTPGEGVSVEHLGKTFGCLLSSHAPNDELARWAEWLGHWLALDAAHRRYRYLAFHDELTGAWNRRYFLAFLADCIERAAPRRRPITVMVFDIDDFKRYNDTFGHTAGDEILRESVRLLTSVIRKGDRVCRIGGDEFAVIFADIEGPREPGSQHPGSIEQIARRFQDEICRMHFPKLGIEAPGTLSISGGLATYPWDGRTPDALLQHADALALESKQKGKNVITLGPGAQQKCCGTDHAETHWHRESTEHADRPGDSVEDR